MCWSPMEHCPIAGWLEQKSVAPVKKLCDTFLQKQPERARVSAQTTTHRYATQRNAIVLTKLVQGTVTGPQTHSQRNAVRDPMLAGMVPVS